MRVLGLFINASAPDSKPEPDVDVGSGVSADVEVEVGFPRFNNLTKLSVGVSDIRDENAVALFLSRLCPLGVEIEYGVTWHADLEEWVTELQDEEDVLTPTNTNHTTNNNNNVTGNNVTTTTITTLPPPAPASAPTFTPPSPAAAALNLTTQISARCKKWEAVGRALPLLTRLRIEEWERGRALEGEVEDLRMRNRVLMDMGCGKGLGKGVMEGGAGCVVG